MLGRPFFHKLEGDRNKNYGKIARITVCFVYQRVRGAGRAFSSGLRRLKWLRYETFHTIMALHGAITDEKNSEYVEETQEWLRVTCWYFAYRSQTMPCTEGPKYLWKPRHRLSRGINHVGNRLRGCIGPGLPTGSGELYALSSNLDQDFPAPRGGERTIGNTAGRIWAPRARVRGHAASLHSSRDKIFYLLSAGLGAYRKAIKDAETSFWYIRGLGDDEALSYSNARLNMTHLYHLVAAELEMA